ncbi:MAG: hypothetical protein HZC41_01780 [Chloroflexi bacterium]|nr:hypothetical protein [Chloroflexota bacterium]
MKYASAVVLLVALLAACSGGSSNTELTLVAQNVELATQIADVRSTATVEADRLRVTAAYVETAMAQSRLQNQRLSATIEALGGNPALVAPVASTPVAPEAGNPSAPEVTLGLVAPLSNETVMAATSTPGQPALYNAVTARGVGANDCALAPVTSFTTADTNIYVVATASNITPGTMLASRWFLEGNEVIAHDFTPDFAIDQNCVWFYIDSTETTFTPGNWTVQLEINGQPTGEPVAFTISG